MDVTQTYALAAGVTFFVFLVAKYLPSIVKARSVSQHLIYPLVIDRHRLIGPWSRAGLLIHLLYIGISIFCLAFRVDTLRACSKRAGTLSVVSMIALFVDISPLSDLLGISVSTGRYFHRACGLMSFALCSLHTVIAVATHASLSSRAHIFEIVVGLPLLGFCFVIDTKQAIGCATAILVLCHPFFRGVSYEIFYHSHRALTILFIYAIWRHLSDSALFPRLYLYASLSAAAVTELYKFTRLLVKNGLVVHGRSRATLLCANNSVRISVLLSKPIKVEAGQYIYIWLPSISFWSFVQSHPFVVTSWNEDEQRNLELFVEPRRGWTAKLLQCAVRDQNTNRQRLVIFSGPYGASVNVAHFSKVLMFADGYGIAAMLPYLRKLIHGYKVRRVWTQHIHLVWQAQDTLDDDRFQEILHISTYGSGQVKFKAVGQRVKAYVGLADIEQILRDEMASTPGDSSTERTLIMVSGTHQQRDEIRRLVCSDKYKNLDMVQLDYQSGN